MTVHRKPKPGSYVVWRGAGETDMAPVEILEDFRVEHVAGHPAAVVVHAKNVDQPGPVLMQRLMRAFGAPARIYQVLVDDDGNVFIPTGRIQTHFCKPLTADRLKGWAEANGLAIVNSSKWRPGAVLFESRSASPGLFTKILENLAADGNLDLVEAETLTHYRRH